MPGRRKGPERFLTTVLFTDIVGSTEVAAALGDAAWRELVQLHHGVVRAALRRHGGREVDTAGDGFFAIFDAPAAAVDCALDVVAGVKDLGLEVRAGLHVGEVEQIGAKVGGITVPISARIMAAASPGEVLVSGTVRDLAAGAGLRFEDRGVRELKGVPGEWDVYAVGRSGNGTAEPATSEARVSRRLAAVRRAQSRPIWQRRPRFVAGAALVMSLLVALGSLFLWSPWRPPTLASVGEDSIGVIDTERVELVGSIAVGQRPGGIAVGEGAVWVTNTAADTVSKIDLITRAVVNSIEVGRGPTGIVAAEGSIWVANSGERTVARINAATGRLVDTITVGNGPTAIAAGAGSVWVANASDSTVVRLDVHTGGPDAPIAVGSLPVGLAVDDAGVWVVNQDDGVVTHLDPRSGATLAPPIAVGTRPTAVAIGAGSVWVASSDGTVTRVDPKENRVTATVELDGSLTSIVVTAGAVWVADLQGAVYRLDPVNPSLGGKSISTVSAGQALAQVGDQVWVATRASSASHRGGTLQLVSFDTPDLDPVLFPFSYLLGLQADGLVGYRRVGGIAGSTLVPDLATAIPKPTDAGKAYTFQLRPDLVYADGQPVRPDDFRRAIERSFQIADAGGGSSGPSYYGAVLGAEACADAPVERCDLSAGIVGDASANTVTFHLSMSEPDFLYHLAVSLAYPVPPDTPANASVEGAFPGTGPYTVSAIGNDEIRLTRNPHFRSWDPNVRPDGFADAIVWRYGIEPAEQVAMVKRGEADLMVSLGGDAIPPESIAGLRAEYTGQLHFAPVTVTSLLLNAARPPFDSLEARQAVSMAIDRAHVAELYGGALAVALTCQVLPPGYPGYQPYCPYTTDPGPGGRWQAPDMGAAQRLVDASGTRGGVVVVGPMRDRSRELGTYLATVLRDLGYQASLDPETDPDKIIEARDTGRTQVTAITWVADIPAPSGFLSAFTCAGNEGLSNYCDPGLDALIEQAGELQTTDQAAALAKWAEVDRAVVDLALWVPLVDVGTEFVSARVGNYQFNPAYSVLLDQLWVQ
jgi:YVTN family beta-propeller protein